MAAEQPVDDAAALRPNSRTKPYIFVLPKKLEPTLEDLILRMNAVGTTPSSRIASGNLKDLIAGAVAEKGVLFGVPYVRSETARQIFLTHMRDMADLSQDTTKGHPTPDSTAEARNLCVDGSVEVIPPSSFRGSATGSNIIRPPLLCTAACTGCGKTTMQALNMRWFSQRYPNSAVIYVTFNDDQWAIACDEVCDYGRYGGTQRGDTGSGVKAAVARRIVHRVLTAQGVSDGLAKEVAAMWATQGAQCLMEVVDWALGPKGLDIHAAA